MIDEKTPKPVKKRKGLLVFTDLDGTLLDDSYSWAAAAQTLEILAAAQFPVVLSSSKTLEEMRELARQIGTNAPLIVENGALIAFPHTSSFLELAGELGEDPDYHLEFAGPPRTEILEAAHRLRSNLRVAFEGFSDWGVDQVCLETGLTPDAAELSLARLGTEPILWNDTEARWKEFDTAFAAAGFRCVKGGRFIHLMGKVDKALGLQRVASVYRELKPNTDWQIVALGDSPNDLEMLSAADIAVVIPNPRHPAGLEPAAERVILATWPGPEGWNGVMQELLAPYSNL